MPGLYTITGNTSSTAVSNTTGLYIGSGQATILNNAQQLLTLLSNNGTVYFVLDPAYGNARVEAFANLSSYGGNIVAQNITATGLFTGNGAGLTDIPYANVTGSFGNANVAAFLPVYTGNVNAAYYFGDGGNLSNITVTYGNANVAAYLPTYGGNVGTGTGYFIGIGSKLTQLTGANVTGTVANATYAATAGSAGTATTAQYVTGLTSANVTTALGYIPLDSNASAVASANLAIFVTGNVQSNITGVGTLTNLTVTNNITSTSGRFIGNGSGLTAITGANVSGTVNAATTAQYVTGLTSANVTTALGYVPLNSNSSAVSANTANTATTAQFVTGLTSANVTTALGYVPLNSNSAAVSAGTASYVTQAAQANITSVGSSLTIGPITIGSNAITSTNDTITIEPSPTGSGGNVVIEGNLRVTGNLTAVNSTQVTVADKNIILANNQTTLLGIDGAGIWLGNVANVPVTSWTYNYTSNAWTSSSGIDLTANIAGGNIIGNGSKLTNITGANVTGTVANATYSTQAGQANNANTAIYVTGLTSANVTTALGYVPLDSNGSAVSAGLATYVTGNSQPNITAVGTLTSLTSSGNISGVYIIGNGSALTNLTGANVAGTVANATYATQAGQANNANTATTSQYVTGLTSANVTTALGYVPADSNAVSSFGNANVAAYLPTYTGNLVSLTGNVTTTANVEAAYLIGNGSAITSVTGANVTGSVNNATTAQYVTGLTSANVTTALGYVPADSNAASNYGNANVAAYLPTYTGNLVSLGGNVITTANITGGNLITTGNTGLLRTTTLQSSYNPNATRSSIAFDSSGNMNLTTVAAGGGPATVNIYSGLNVLSGNIAAFGGNLNGTANVNLNSTGTTATYWLGRDPNGFFANTGGSIFTPVRIAGWTNSMANASVATVGLYLQGNVVLNRDNNNNSARVRPTVVNGLFGANGYASSIGMTPFGNGGSDSSLITGASRMPSNAYNINILNSQGASTQSNISSIAAGFFNASVSSTNQRANVNYAIGLESLVGITSNDTTSQILNATAYRADFVAVTGNAAQVANRLVLEAIDPTANIMIAGNIVSTTANVVAVGGAYSGNVSAAYFLGDGSQLTGLPATYANANVKSFLEDPLNGITTAYLQGVTGTGTDLTFISPASGNIILSASNSVTSAANIVTTANVQANYFIGNGSQLTGISTAPAAGTVFNPFLLAGM